jgi:uracil-DNA glycosylase
MASEFLNKVSVNKDWKPFLTTEIRERIKQVENEVLPKEITPPAEKALRFLEFPLKSARVIILGQDPYPQPGAATGRAFEVGNLKSWNQPFKNISLKNILRALFKAYTGEVLKYNDLKQKFDNEFPVLPPSLFFQNWEKEGVLLLNTSYTCTPGKPGSHRKNWEEFTHILLDFINHNASEATWFLWGNHAKEATAGIHLQNSIFTMHPMMCYNLPERENDFLFGKKNCFEPFIGEIDWTGYDLKKELTKTGKLF